MKVFFSKDARAIPEERFVQVKGQVSLPRMLEDAGVYLGRPIMSNCRNSILDTGEKPEHLEEITCDTPGFEHGPTWSEASASNSITTPAARPNSPYLSRKRESSRLVN